MSEATKAKEMDMLNGKLAGKLILFAIPLAFSIKRNGSIRCPPIRVAAK